MTPAQDDGLDFARQQQQQQSNGATKKKGKKKNKKNTNESSTTPANITRDKKRALEDQIRTSMTVLGTPTTSPTRAKPVYSDTPPPSYQQTGGQATESEAVAESMAAVAGSYGGYQQHSANQHPVISSVVAPPSARPNQFAAMAEHRQAPNQAAHLGDYPGNIVVSSLLSCVSGACQVGMTEMLGQTYHAVRTVVAAAGTDPTAARDAAGMTGTYQTVDTSQHGYGNSNHSQQRSKSSQLRAQQRDEERKRKKENQKSEEEDDEKEPFLLASSSEEPSSGFQKKPITFGGYTDHPGRGFSSSR